MESLKTAFSSAGLEATAPDLTIACTAPTENSMAAASTSHSATISVTQSDNKRSKESQISQIQRDHDWKEHRLLKISDYQ